MTNASHYFATARERYLIKLRRFDQKLPPPWTQDTVYKEWSFCNVFREDDVTTAWFRSNIREHLTGAAVVRATVAFRWYNRISTGKVLKDILLGDRWNHEEVLSRLKALPPDQPVFTGAYMIKSFNGRPKLESITQNVTDALPRVTELCKGWGNSLQEATIELSLIPFLGPFMAYEIVSDLRHTDVLRNANDILSWANTGPGCKHGLGRVMNNDPQWFMGANGMPASVRAYQMLKLMRQLLDMSRNPDYWPSEWPRWEMREVEHWACEYDKYCRGAQGIHLKRRFVPTTMEINTV